MCVKVDHIPMVFKFFIKKSDFSIQKQSKFCRSKIFSIQKTRRPYKKQRQETYKRVSCRRRRHDTLSFLAKPRSLVSVGVPPPKGEAHPRLVCRAAAGGTTHAGIFLLLPCFSYGGLVFSIENFSQF